MIELTTENKPLVNQEKLLPRKERVVISDGLLFRTSACFDELVGGMHYRLTLLKQFKPLSFLGEYVSTFVRTGLYSEQSLEDEVGLRVHRSAPHYLRVNFGF